MPNLAFTNSNKVFRNVSKGENLLLTITHEGRSKNYVLIVDNCINNIFGNTVVTVSCRRSVRSIKLYFINDEVCETNGKPVPNCFVQLSRTILTEKAMPRWNIELFRNLLPTTISTFYNYLLATDFKVTPLSEYYLHEDLDGRNILDAGNV